MRYAVVAALLVCLGFCLPAGAASPAVAIEDPDPRRTTTLTSDSAPLQDATASVLSRDRSHYADRDARGPDHHATAPRVQRPPPDLHDQVETDRIVLTAAVRANGDAQWQIEYRTDLDDENTTEAFETLQADVRANPDNYTDRFAERIRTTVRTAENATGREMTASGFDISASIDAFQNQGVVTYTFEWSNFARVATNRIYVGDAIAGFALYSDTRLEVQWPDGWTADEVDPQPSSSSAQSALWRGTEVSFGPDQPSVVLVRAEPTPTRTATATATITGTGGGDGTATGTTDPGGGTTDATTGGAGEPPTEGGGGADAESGGGPPLGLLVVLALLVAGGGVAYWRFSDRLPSTGGDRPTTTTDDGPAPTANGGAQAANGGTTGRAPDADGGSEPPTGEATAESESGDDQQPPIDLELLSNEERVLHLLEQNGGRMKQQEVVEELGWTEAKTSQVVTGMREDDQLDSFRLGRENVLTLPDTEIDPTEEEEGDT